MGLGEEGIVYFTKLPPFGKEMHHYMQRNWSPTKKLVFTALLAAIATMLQASGGFFPVVGFIISPFTTLPILLGALVSLRYGLFTYVLTTCLLFIIQPSELFVYPFTTGLLGLVLGFGLWRLGRRWMIVVISGLVLSIGICIPLYILKFPVLGPGVSGEIHFPVVLILLLFSILYSWIWLALGLFFIKRIQPVLQDEYS